MNTLEEKKFDHAWLLEQSDFRPYFFSRNLLRVGWIFPAQLQPTENAISLY